MGSGIFFMDARRVIVRHYGKVNYRKLPTGSIPIALWEKMAACGADSRVISGGF